MLSVSPSAFDPSRTSVARRFRNAPNPSARAKALAAKNMRGHFSSIFQFSKTDRFENGDSRGALGLCSRQVLVVG
jgi:hypothetical protein